MFFGNFHHSTLPEYEKAMKIMLKDPDYLYGTMIQDIFQLGVVLGRKYRLLRLGYNIFMYGVVASVFAFALAVTIFT